MNDMAIDRRSFLQHGAAAALAAGTVGAQAVARADAQPAAAVPSAKRVKVAVIGCGSVSTKYLPYLAATEHVELVAVCDRRFERAEAAAGEHGVADAFPHVDKLLANSKFDMLVNLTDMQEHEHLNFQAVKAGRHVWSEKPMANSLEAGQELLALAERQGVRVWGAPTVVNSPQFRFMARTLAAGTLGRVSAAHASYGHLGPGWSAFFYEAGGGSMPDLGVYNLTTLTGLLGPAKAVTAMTGVVTPKRTVDDKGEVTVTAEDNAMVLIDHGGGALSHTQSGFNYFTPREHGHDRKDHHSIVLYGTRGCMAMAGYDWEPLGVDVATQQEPTFRRHAERPEVYVWQQGASLAARALLGGEEPPFRPEHALHVVEIMSAARTAQATGRRVPIRSTFKWPVYG
jgi:predicted dehydrogenase